MDFLKDFIKPELLVLAPVLYFIGTVLKRKMHKDYLIPILLGVIGIVLSMLYMGATCNISSFRSVLLCLFTAITQGILCAGASVYVHQMVKQMGEKCGQDSGAEKQD